MLMSLNLFKVFAVLGSFGQFLVQTLRKILRQTYPNLTKIQTVVKLFIKCGDSDLPI